MIPIDCSPPVQKRRGRPPVNREPNSTPLTTYVPASYYDRVARLASAEGHTIASFVRHLVFLQLKPQQDPEGAGE